MAPRGPDQKYRSPYSGFQEQIQPRQETEGNQREPITTRLFSFCFLVRLGWLVLENRHKTSTVVPPACENGVGTSAVLRLTDN